MDDDPVDHTLYSGNGGLGRQAVALHTELTAERASTRRGAGDRTFGTRAPLITAGPTWSSIAAETTPDPRWQVTPDLTVLALDRLEVDRMFTDALLRADQPHLIVRPTARGVVVGPFVLPGRTPCLRCTDLVRCELDPDWPGLLSQLSRTVGSPTEPLLTWAAGVTVIQVVSVLGALGDPSRTWPESAGATIELGSDGIQRRRSWPAHPSCGCGWDIAEPAGPAGFDDRSRRWRAEERNRAGFAAD